MGFTSEYRAFTIHSRFGITLAKSCWSDTIPERAMEKETPRIRIELTPEQRKKIKEASGEDVTALEFTAQELESRIAPMMWK